jgi:fumarate reductase subunit D
MSEQNRQIEKLVAEAIRKHRIPLMIVVCFFIGTIDVVHALRRHNTFDAIAVSVIYFVLAPVFTIWTKRPIGTDR